MQKIFLLAILILSPFNLNCFIYKIDILQNDLGQKIFLLGDVHHENIPSKMFKNKYPEDISEIQSKQLISIIKKNHPINSNLIILEDSYSNYEGSSQLNSLSELITKDTTGFMNKVRKFSLLNKIQVINVEFRQIFHVLNFFAKKLKSEIQQEIMVNEIIRNEYKYILLAFNEFCESNNNFSNNDLMVNLLDARIIHFIYKYKDKNNIFVCAGGSHTTNILNFLTNKSDYKIVKQINSASDSELLKCKPINIEKFCNITNSKLELKANL